MLNLRLMELLLGGLAETTHVVFVGDADQLPPIGAGKPFEDLIASERAPVVRLTQIFRQAAESMITTAAHEINQGRMPHLDPEGKQKRDFVFLERHNPTRLREAVVEVVAERAPAISASTRSARSRSWRPSTKARSGSTRSTSCCAPASTPTANRSTNASASATA